MPTYYMPNGTRHWSLEAKIAYYADIGGPDECWPWRGARDGCDYAQLHWKGQVRRVGRLIVKPRKGLQVRHSCDNPPCVNPRHLSAGTYLQNADDKRKRGRLHLSILHGEEHGSSKLTARQVTLIRQLYKAGKLTQVELARRFGIKQPQISTIVRGGGWKHLPI